MEGCPCSDLQWPFIKLTVEIEHTNKARGRGCCWTMGGTGVLVPSASPAARHCWQEAQSHLQWSCIAHSCVCSACQVSGTGHGCSKWLTISFAHTRTDAPRHCCVVAACMPASVPWEGQPRCWGQPWMCTHMLRRAFAHAAFYLLSIITTRIMASK